MQTHRKIFFDLIQNYFTNMLDKHSIPVQGLRHINASHVNFVFECKINHKDIILKANFYGRSMLFAYEKFLDDGALGFSARLREYGEDDDKFEMLLEKQALNLLAENGVRTPPVKGFIYPNILLLEKLYGNTLDKEPLNELLSNRLTSILVLIHSIPPPLGCRKREIEIRDGVIVIKDPNFERILLFDRVAKNVTTAISSYTNRQCFLHGDFKGNNIFFDGEKISILDPKPCVGIPHTDLGKFGTRLILTGRRKDLPTIKHGLELMFRQYSQTFGFDARETEEVSVAMGLMELNHLLEQRARANIDILGHEILELYEIKPLVLYLSELVLRRGEMMTIEKLCSFMER